MTRALYLFVREGVAKDIEPKRRYAGPTYGPGVPDPSPHEDIAEIVIGGDGGAKVFPYWQYGSFSFSSGFTEVSRETTTKRVENPNDSQQYVDVEQIDKLKVKRDSNPTDQMTLTLKNPKK